MYKSLQFRKLFIVDFLQKLFYNAFVYLYSDIIIKERIHNYENENET